MKIDSIKITNFKSIKSLEIVCNDTFNVLIGENNIGKTTIFEAILLWKKLYDIHIKQNKKEFYAHAQNIPFHEVNFIRITDDINLFNEVKRKTAIATIEIIFQNNGSKFQLGFEIAKVASIDNAYFQVRYQSKEDFVRFAKMTAERGKNLRNIIMISETRPIAHIVSKEPKMYDEQIIAKMAKGRGYEVLRNKITQSNEKREKIGQYVSNVMNEDIQFIEKSRDMTGYIKVMVKKGNNTVDLLSQGSGFLQIAEIFSSLEYAEADLHIFLIDEPDSHIHAKLQKELLKQFKEIANSQLFIITHNEKFIYEVNDEEILFINDEDKELGIIRPLEVGSKAVVVENMVGNLHDIDKLRYTEKIILVEGPGDEQVLNDLYSTYCAITGEERKEVYLRVLGGIDGLADKLDAYSKAYKNLVDRQVKWIVLRDTDCIPINKKTQVAGAIKNSIYFPNKDVIFQDGYGIESTMFTDIDKLSGVIAKHYEKIEAKEIIKSLICRLNEIYAQDIRDCTKPIYSVFNDNFRRQVENRKEKVYKELELGQILVQINKDNIQYIMTKKIMDMYLENLHELIADEGMDNQKIALTHKSILQEYLMSINSKEEFYTTHIDLLRSIYEINE